MDSTAGSSASRWWWLVPPVAALLYPYAVKALYESGRLLHEAVTRANYAVAWLALAVSVALTYGVVAVSIGVAHRLAREDKASPSARRARRFAHLAMASPSLFVLIGVLFYLLHSANGDYALWWILWLAALAAVALGMRTERTDTNAAPALAPAWLRVAHGTSALVIVLAFLAWHLLNHASAVLSITLNEAMMKALRSWYRSELVQPVLVTLMLFQVASGVTLLWRATAARGDLYRTLQLSTGALMSAFIVSHLNAVFVLGRAVTHADTTFLWASGAPVGLLPDAWNVRLIPHYSLGVWFVIIHAGLGLRAILLDYRISPLVASRVAWSVCALGALVALVITAAQLSVHGAG